jgi:hypothetical protein
VQEKRCGECLKPLANPGDVEEIRDGMVTYTIHRTGICSRVFKERLRGTVHTSKKRCPKGEDK